MANRIPGGCVKASARVMDEYKAMCCIIALISAHGYAHVLANLLDTTSDTKNYVN